MHRNLQSFGSTRYNPMPGIISCRENKITQQTFDHSCNQNRWEGIQNQDFIFAATKVKITVVERFYCQWRLDLPCNIPCYIPECGVHDYQVGFWTFNQVHQHGLEIFTIATGQEIEPDEMVFWLELTNLWKISAVVRRGYPIDNHCWSGFNVVNRSIHRNLCTYRPVHVCVITFTRFCSHCFCICNASVWSFDITRYCVCSHFKRIEEQSREQLFWAALYLFGWGKA